MVSKRVLITAGPTWVPIDKVRVISNTATGETGILLANRLNNLGAKVTLVLGPVSACSLDRRIKLLRYRFFDELRLILNKELRRMRYDIVVHSAAVSDFKPKNRLKGKLKSGRKSFNLRLVPTEKIINRIRKLSPQSFLVGFKYEPDAGKMRLVSRAKKLLIKAELDLVVANSRVAGRYAAYVIAKDGLLGKALHKKESVAKFLGDSLRTS